MAQGRPQEIEMHRNFISFQNNSAKKIDFNYLRFIFIQIYNNLMYKLKTSNQVFINAKETRGKKLF